MLDEIARIVRSSRCAVVLTGAGASAESGVPTFRGREGLWKNFRPEELATMDAFLANPKVVWEWYNWRRELMSTVEPNAGHLALVELARFFERFTLITQNVDNLHQAAGSTDVLELHGNIHRNKCADCNHPYPVNTAVEPEALPLCPDCGGKIRPDVVWFGELLPEGVLEKAFTQSEQADIFFSVGTSAVVQPAASLPARAKQAGAILVEINPHITPLSGFADYILRKPSAEILPQLLSLLRDSEKPPANSETTTNGRV